MNSRFPGKPLEQIVVPVERSEAPVPGTKYRQVGVRLWGEGAYEREVLDGSQTKYRTLSRVEKNDIIVNKIWARNGSVAVIKQELAGSYVSGEFPTFTPIVGKLEPRWFHWFTKTRMLWDQCDEKCVGRAARTASVLKSSWRLRSLCHVFQNRNVSSPKSKNSLPKSPKPVDCEARAEGARRSPYEPQHAKW